MLAVVWAGISLLLPGRLQALDVGVGTHFGQGKTDEQAFETWSNAMKIDSLRDEIYWDHVERAPGVFRLEGDALRTANVVRAAKARGMKPLLVLDYSNDLYGGGLPTTDAARAGFARYSTFVAKTLSDSVDDFEVWNEWNLGAGSAPKVKEGSPQDYVALLKVSSAAVKQANTRARVIAGAVGDDLNDWSWMRRAIAAGMLRYADAVSIHLYNFMQGPEARGVPEFLRRIDSLHALLKKLSPQREVPILITEVGWPNHIGVGRVEPAEAAAELLSLLLALREMPYVRGVWFYEFRDGGNDAGAVHQNFGLVMQSYQQKPSSPALAYAIELLKHGRTRLRLATAGFRGHVLELPNDQLLLAIWRSADNECKERAVVVQGLSSQAAPESLEFLHPRSHPRVRPEAHAWTVDGDSLPQLFRIDSHSLLSQLRLAPVCAAPSSWNAKCAVDSVKCLLP